MKKTLTLIFLIIITMALSFLSMSLYSENKILGMENELNRDIIENLNDINYELILKIEIKTMEKTQLEIQNSNLIEQLLELETISRGNVQKIEIAPSPTPTPTLVPAIKQSDLEMLARIIFCEAGGEPEQDQLAVGQVILNRSEKYGLSLKETIYQRLDNGTWVFSPVRHSNYSTRPYSEESKNIAKRLLSGEKYLPVGQALYFCTIDAYNKKEWHYDYVNFKGGQITLKTKSTIYIR